MHVVIRKYSIDAKESDQIVGRLRDSFAPLITGRHGFVSYGAALGTNGSSELVTMSTFEDRAGSEASNALAADWVRANLAQFTLSPPHYTDGEVVVGYRKDNVPARCAVMRTYTGISDVDEIVRRVNDYLVPFLAETPGLTSFFLVDAGSGVGIAMSTYADYHSAEAAGLIMRQWIKGNLGNLVPNPPEELIGDIKLRIVPAGVLV